jgi:tRNA(Ile2) C34 agmatinyltransferase TiaS
MTRKCPKCGKFMRVKGTIYYCKNCAEYYFEPIFSSEDVDERAEMNKTIEDLGVEKIEK